MINKLSKLVELLKLIIKSPLNINRPVRAITNFFLFQIRSRFARRHIIFHWIGNTKFFVQRGEPGLTLNIYCGLHEFEEMAYVLHVLDKKDIFVDVGANLGSYTILACGINDAHGFCFEPIPEVYNKLQNNIILNDIQDQVKLFNVGIGKQEDELFFTRDLGPANHILTASDEYLGKKTRVKVFPLDTFLHNEMPTLLKVDVEGFETLVINGGLETLQKPSLHSVILELTGIGEKRGFDEDRLVDQMKSFGFLPYLYDPFLRSLVLLEGKNTTGNNTLFCRQIRIDHIRKKVKEARPFLIYNQSI